MFTKIKKMLKNNKEYRLIRALNKKDNSISYAARISDKTFLGGGM